MNWNIAAHDWVVQILQNHMRSGNSRHAYLFVGPQGIGRRTISLRFIQALNCLNPPTVGEFCGECRVCRQVLQMQHPDLFIGEAETQGGILKIDTVREIQHSLSLQPYEARWRVALFLRFDEANQNAQNALLKTLEEPPENVKMILTASMENALLPTILSRCEIIRLRPMPLADLQKILMDEWNADEEHAWRIAHLAAGRIGFAVSLLQNEEKADTILETAREGLELLSQNTRQRFRYAEKFKDVRKRGDLRNTLQIWQSLFRDLLLLSTNSNLSGELPLTFVDLKFDLSGIAEKVPSERFLSVLNQINHSMDYLDANVNLQLLTENLLLEWPSLH